MVGDPAVGKHAAGQIRGAAVSLYDARERPGHPEQSGKDRPEPGL